MTLDDWNAAQERAKAAYDTAPDAFAQELARVCGACYAGACYRCVRTNTGHGRAACACRTRRHRRTWFRW